MYGIDVLYGIITWAMEKNPGWLGYLGDGKLPNYIGMIISHYMDPY